MSKALKIIGIIVGALLILFIIAGILLTHLIDLNKYKSKISQEVYQSTGHHLVINGTISWSFFPWLGLKVSDVALSNLPGFDGDNMATVKEADVKVALLPLFIGHVDIANITLNGLNLNLMKNRQGKSNWQNPNQTKQTETVSPAKASEKNQSTSKLNLEVENVDVSGGNIHWRDLQSQQDILLQNIQIHGKNIGFNNPFSIEISSQVISQTPKVNAKIQLSGDFDINNGFSRFSLTDLSASVNNLTLKGQVTGSMNDNNTNYSGTVSLESFNPKAWLASMNMPTIATVNPDALTNTSGEIQFKGTANSINMNSIKITLDNSHLTGNFMVTNFSTQEVRFKLHADQLNADDYMMKSTASQSSGQASAHGTAKTPAQNLPINSMRKLNIYGSMDIDKLNMMRLHLTKASVLIDARAGVLKLAPVSANLYNGSTTTYITYDVRPNIPNLSITSNMKQVQIQPLMNDFMNINKVSGITDFSLSTNARGANSDSILRTLNGDGRFSLTKGEIKGVNLGYQVQQAEAMLSKSAKPSKPSDNNTEIGLMRGTFKINNGIVNNNDLQIQTPLLQASGKGSINLPQQSMDYNLNLVPVRSNNLQGQRIPFRIHGPLANLSYNVDIGSLLQTVAQQQLKSQANKFLENDKLKAQGKKLLGGLFK